MNAFLKYFKGETGPMVAATLKLGIAILNGGNSTVQQVMSLRNVHNVPFKQIEKTKFFLYVKYLYFNLPK